MIIIYFIIGALSGTVAGLLGIGGGVIVVPALATIFAYFKLMPAEHVMHVAIATSMAVMIVTLLSTLVAYAKRKSVRWEMVRLLLPGIILGAIAGVFIAYYLPSSYLSTLFGVFLLFMAFRLFFGKEQDPIAKLPSVFLMWSAASIIGALSAILGAGGGTMLIPFIMRYRIPLREAAGTSVACGVWLACVVTGGFMFFAQPISGLAWSTGYIYWPAFLGVSLTSVMFVPLGTAAAHKLPTPILKRIFALFLVLIGIDMLFFS